MRCAFVVQNGSMLKLIQQNLEHAFAAGRPAQGYILVGPVRQEGRQLAEWIGTKLIGDVPTIAAHAHPSMPWFEPEKVSRIIDVKMMRERILPVAQQSTLAGGWKVIVIVSADRMKAEAANAFLKTLEEPPPQTLFLLLVDTLSDLLPTIISRSQVIHVGGARRLDEPWRTQVLTLLAEIEEKSVLLDEARADVLAGIIDEMSERAEKEVKAEHKEARAIVEDSDTLKALVGAKSKAWRNDLLLTLEQWMQDLVRMKAASGTESVLNFPSYRAVLEKRAALYPLARLLENLSMLETFAEQLERNLPPAQILPYWMDRFYL